MRYSFSDCDYGRLDPPTTRNCIETMSKRYPVELPAVLKFKPADILPKIRVFGGFVGGWVALIFQFEKQVAPRNRRPVKFETYYEGAEKL